MLFGLILFGFYVLVATFPGSAGGFQRSFLALTPFCVVLAVAFFESVIPKRWMGMVGLALFLLLCGFQSIQASRLLINRNAVMGKQLHAIRQIVAYDAAARNLTDDVVIMTRNPWQVHLATGFKTIQIPNDDLETIYRVATKYGADYMILPAPRLALTPIADGTVKDERFQLVPINTGSWMQVFRVN